VRPPLLLCLLLLGATPSIPWPYGAPPSSTHLTELIKDAVILDDRDQFEEWLAASEKYEDSDNLMILQERVDHGDYDKPTLFRLGDELFDHEFNLDNGYGDRSYVSPRRIHAGVRGGTDTFSCAGCHSVGGPDGAGSPTQNAFLAGDGDRTTSANVRNPPALLGVGLVQALAAEMSTDLRGELTRAMDKAKASFEPVTVALASKGVSFGSVTVTPEGGIDGAPVGVNPDLVIRPFGWKGTVARLRRFVEDAARIHFGIQSSVLLQQNGRRRDPAHLGAGPEWWDPDGDGKARELEEGVLTATACYLAMLEAPVILPPHDQHLRERWANGSRLFDATGCAGCHVREMPLHDRAWHERADTTAGDVVIDVLADGDGPKGPAEVKLFSDLKRHEMGPELADRHDNEDGVSRSAWLTRPLWGLAESAPYLHDGRAATLSDAILAHGGEAAPAREAFAALSRDEQADVQVFLLSLTREPKVRFAR
jgi:Di-haem oxidoreductase, putative peroxidase